MISLNHSAYDSLGRFTSVTQSDVTLMTSARAIADTDADLYFGGRGATDGDGLVNEMNGRIADVQIYDRVLDASEIGLLGRGNASYAYDANGNRTSSTVDGLTTTYATGQYNRVEVVGNYTYGYDAEGNTVARFIDGNSDGKCDSASDTEVTRYVWDHRNRLIEASEYADGDDATASQTVDYAYDYLNRMVARTIDEDGVGVTFSPATEYFVYDGDGATNWALADASTSEDGTIPFGADPTTDAGQIVLQLDENGQPTHRYLWGPAVDMLLAEETVDDGGAEDVAWTLGDNQNSVRDIVAWDDVVDEWVVENHITYDAYGNVVSPTGADCIFGWTGRFFDNLTGLQNNTNRWYDPSVGRWISEDPIGLSSDENPYRYCGNDPVNWIDPSGLAGRVPLKLIDPLPPKGSNSENPDNRVAVIAPGVIRCPSGLIIDIRPNRAPIKANLEHKKGIVVVIGAPAPSTAAYMKYYKWSAEQRGYDVVVIDMGDASQSNSLLDKGLPKGTVGIMVTGHGGYDERLGQYFAASISADIMAQLIIDSGTPPKFFIFGCCDSADFWEDVKKKLAAKGYILPEDTWVVSQAGYSFGEIGAPTGIPQPGEELPAQDDVRYDPGADLIGSLWFDIIVPIVNAYFKNCHDLPKYP